MAKKKPTKKNTAKKLTLRSRLCKIGTNINVRTEKHGDQPVPACDIPLKGVMLSKDELNTLLGDDGAFDALYRDVEGTPEPIFAKHFKPFVLVDTFEGAGVKLQLSDVKDGIEVELEDVSLNALKLEPQVGGLTSLNLQVQAAPDSDDMSTIIAFVDAQVRVAISFGKRSEKDKRQKELPMGDQNPEAAEHPDPDSTNEADGPTEH